MIEEKLALLRTHRNAISRYRRLLKTQLTEFERQFIERRLADERAAMERIASTAFPLGIGNSDAGWPRAPDRPTPHPRPASASA